VLKLETDPRTSFRKSPSSGMRGNHQTAVAVANPYFQWDIPSENLEVLLHLNVVELAEATTNRAGNGYAAGVLLGRVQASRKSKIVIEGLESATPEEGAPESPFKDRQAVTLFLERVQSRSGRLSVMGFYRSCGREGAALNPDDLNMLTCSAESSNDAVGSASTDAGNGRTPPLEVVSRTANQKNAERLFLMIEPRGTRGSNASIYLSRKGMVLWQSPRIPLHRTELARIGSVCQVPGAGIREVSAPRGPAVSPIEPEKAKKRTLTAMAVIAAVALISLFRWSGLQGLVTPATHAEINYEQPIGLQAEKKGADWQVRWNKSSYALRQAKKTRVEIEDGLIRKEFAPSAAELANGTILYSPDTDNVVLTMETESDQPDKSFRETVRLISALPPEPRMNDGLSTASPRPLPRKPEPKSSTTAPPLVPTRSERKNSRPIDTREAASTNTPPPLPPDQAEPTSMPDNASVPNATPENLPVLSVLLADLPNGLSKRNDLKSADSEGPQRPELISRTNPIYPEEAKTKHVEGTVEVGFRITSDGDVENVKVLSGDPVLAEATVRAVRGWKYKPARLGGLPAEVPGHVVVKFSLK
jgi:TonB family protein